MTELLHSIQKGGYTYLLRSVSCGKNNCNRCPHGPYWYLQLTTATGKRRLRYLGKEVPPPVADEYNEYTKTRPSGHELHEQLHGNTERAHASERDQNRTESVKIEPGKPFIVEPIADERASA